MKSAKYPSITVGVVTYVNRLTAFETLLSYLLPAIEQYQGVCEFVVANNSGESFHQRLQESIQSSGLKKLCACNVVDSSQNNIATGRNTIIDNASHDWLAFLDDDEYPSELWLSELCEVALEWNAVLVAGPIFPIYEPGTAKWITTVDIHNIKGLNTGDQIPYAAAGNCLIHLPSIGTTRFNEQYGKTGGEDTEFFLQLTERSAEPLALIWAKDAAVMEDIPSEKATTKYIFDRCLSQGNNYKRVLIEAEKISNPWVFNIKAATVFIVSILIAIPLILLRHHTAGDWVKRGISNLGKLYTPRNSFY